MVNKPIGARGRSALQGRVDAIDSTRGLPKQLVEERCSEKIAVRKWMQKVNTAAVVPYVQCAS